jgi:PIN domain nuclease of toxin-antitoxin system
MPGTCGSCRRITAIPFDRLLVAQALSERLPIVSADARFGAYGVETRW